MKENYSDPSDTSKEAFSPDRRPLVQQLASIEHVKDHRSILEHTRKVLAALQIPSNVTMPEGITVSPADLLQEVATYHDLDKLFPADRPQANSQERKQWATQAAIREIEQTRPSFFHTTADRTLFATLMRTCDYLGYNLPVLKKPESEREFLLQEIADRKINREVEYLEQEGIEMDPEMLLVLQYAVSRADTVAIDAFRANAHAVDQLYKALQTKLT